MLRLEIHIATQRGYCLLLWRIRSASHNGEMIEESKKAMASAIKTNGTQATVKLSATNLSLNVTNEAEFKNLYEGFRAGIAKTEAETKVEAKVVRDTARRNLWIDLSGALEVARGLMLPENAEWLCEALESHDIPPVNDPDKANEFLPVVRLMMGHWTDRPKGWKEGDDEPPFVCSRSKEVYAKVLRAANAKKLNAQTMLKRLEEDKGYNKLKVADDNRHLKHDEADQERIKRQKAVCNDVPKASLDAAAFAIPKKDKPSLVCLWAVVSEDRSTLHVQGHYPASVSSIEAYIDRVSPTLYPEVIRRRQMQEELARRDKEIQLMKDENEELTYRLAGKSDGKFVVAADENSDAAADDLVG